MGSVVGRELPRLLRESHSIPFLEARKKVVKSETTPVLTTGSELTALTLLLVNLVALVLLPLLLLLCQLGLQQLLLPLALLHMKLDGVLAELLPAHRARDQAEHVVASVSGRRRLAARFAVPVGVFRYLVVVVVLFDRTAALYIGRRRGWTRGRRGPCFAMVLLTSGTFGFARLTAALVRARVVDGHLEKNM